MRSLYLRVFLISMCMFAVSGLLGLYVANLYYHWALKFQNDANLLRSAEMMRAFVEQYPAAMEDYLPNAAALGYQLYLYGETGGGVFYGGAFSHLDLAAEIRDSVLSGEVYHGVAESPNKPFVLGYFENRLSNTVGVPVAAGPDRYALFLRHDASLQCNEMRVFFAVMLAAAVIFSIPYLLLCTRYLVQPITLLTEATKRIAAGNYKLELPTNRKDEIGQLAAHFQKMSKQLEWTDKANKEFSSNVSHEIHASLSSIQGFADSLQRKDIGDSQVQYYARVISEQARHLSSLCRQLLLLSTLDGSGKGAIEKKAFPLRPQLRQALRLLEWQLAEKEISVRMLVSERLHIYGDEVLLMQVWSNVLSNAVQHIPAGRSIDIEASREEDCCVVKISDTGDGIPAARLPFIFDRFYRGDSARQPGTGSTGLGLSIVQKIVQLHGGAVEAENRPGGGMRFRIRIPDA